MQTLLQIPTHSVVPSRHQSRKFFSSQELEELAASIRMVGLLQPIVVRPLGNEQYELIAGERRWRASVLAGIQVVPALVQEPHHEQNAALMTLIENLQRANLNALEEAEAYQQLQKDFGLTQEEVALRVGKKRSTIANVLRLLTLPSELQQAVREGALSLGHAKALLSVADYKERITLGKAIEKKGWSVRELEKRIALSKRSSNKKTPITDPDTLLLTRSLEYHLGARCHIQSQSLTVHFDSDEDLERILDCMGLETGASSTFS